MLKSGVRRWQRMAPRYGRRIPMAARNPMTSRKVWAGRPGSAPFAEREQARTELGNQVIRLNAFMSLATFQMEKIRVKYRPVGFACHIPFVTPLVSLFNGYCTPIRTAP